MLVLPDVTESFFVGRYPLLRREGNYHCTRLRNKHDPDVYQIPKQFRKGYPYTV